MSKWETEVGGALEEFSGTIHTANYTYDSRYQGGQAVVLKLEVTADDEPDPERRERTILYSPGSGWTSTDGGKKAVHERGPEQKFRRSSMVGRLIEFARNEPKLLEELERRGDPTDARVWEGLRFHWAPTVVSFGRGIEDQEKLLPVEYLGTEAATKAGSANRAAEANEATGGSVVTSVSASSPAPVASAPNPKVLEAKLRKLAKESSTHQEFMDLAVEFDGVTDDDVLLERVIDADGFYAEARR